MTPSGVEHMTSPRTATRSVRVAQTMTPSGVEHNTELYLPGIEPDRGPDDDALGR